MIDNSFVKFNIRAIRNLSIGHILTLSAITGALSLLFIAIRIGPIASYSKTLNRCVQTTSGFLATVPGFQSAGKDGLEAMSVSLCNGSTPQKAEGSSAGSK